jgi:hypothetical protein
LNISFVHSHLLNISFAHSHLLNISFVKKGGRTACILLLCFLWSVF